MSGASLERPERLAAAVGAQELDALLLSGAVAVRYATGFTGTSGLALISAAGEEPDAAVGDGLQDHRFITDFRYATQAAEQVPDAFERDVVVDNLLEGVAGALGPRGGRLGFLEKSVTVAEHMRLRELLDAAWELVPSGASRGDACR